jgi:hypothetical protein
MWCCVCSLVERYLTFGASMFRVNVSLCQAWSLLQESVMSWHTLYSCLTDTNVSSVICDRKSAELCAHFRHTGDHVCRQSDNRFVSTLNCSHWGSCGSDCADSWASVMWHCMVHVSAYQSPGYMHSDPWEGIKKFSPVWASENGGMEDGPFQGPSVFSATGGKWNDGKRWPFLRALWMRSSIAVSQGLCLRVNKQLECMK